MKILLMILFSVMYFFVFGQVPGLEVEGDFREHIRMKRAQGFIDITATQSPQGMDIIDTAGTRLMSIISASGSGSTIGKLGLGTNLPQSMLSVKGPDDYFNGPNILLTGKSSDQVESGRIRFVEGTATNNFRGGYLHYDGAANRFHIGVHNTSNGEASDDLNALTIHRGNGFVGLGTTNPQSKLHVQDAELSTGQRKILGLFESTFNKRPAVMFGTNGTTIGFGIEYDGNIGSNLNKLKIFYKDANEDRDIMTINNGTDNGKVGINTSVPKVDFEVSSTADPAIRITNPSIFTGHPKLEFDEPGTTSDWNIHTEAGGLMLSEGNVNGTMKNHFKFDDDQFIPLNSGVVDLGASLRRWKGIYLAESPNVSSDRRLKSQVTRLAYGLEAVLQLNPVSYYLSDNMDHKSLGLIAQEVKNIIPELVDVPEDPEAHLSMRYSELIPVLIKAIQEQNDQIQTLRSVCDTLQNEIYAARRD